MPRAYADDLRCKLREAYPAGQGSLQELAKQLRVSWGYAKRFVPSSGGRNGSSGPSRYAMVVPAG